MSLIKLFKRRMHIAFDVRQISDAKPSGIGVYLIKILRYLLNKEVKISLISDSGRFYLPSDLKNNKNIKFFYKKREKRSTESAFDKLYKLYWEEKEVNNLLKKIKPDLYHAVGNNGVPSLDMPRLVTIHDLIPLILKQKNYMYYCGRYLAYKLSVERATKIIAISENTKKDLIRFFPETKNKIELIYNGVEEVDIKENDFKNKFKIDRYKPYILYYGGFNERKEVKNIILAFKKIIKIKKFQQLKLLIIGEKKLISPYIFNLVNTQKVSKRIIFLDHMMSEGIYYFLRNALFMIYASKYEGFGFPPLEAMINGCPSLISKNSSLPEVGGKAALYLEDNSVDEIYKRMIQLIEDEKLRKKLIVRGYKQKNKFNLDKSCDKLYNIYLKLIKS